MELINYMIEEKYKQVTAHSEIDERTKYYMDGCWYLESARGYEGVAESMVSDLLSFTNCDDYVSYEVCQINGNPGCRCKNFLSGDRESYISFEAAHQRDCGSSLTQLMTQYQDAAARIRYTIDFIRDYCGLDCTEYLRMIASLDMITLNIDRNFLNLGLIKNGRHYRFAPVFDYSAALLSILQYFPTDLPLEENVKAAAGGPFCENLEEQAQVLGTNLSVDFSGLSAYLETLPASRANDTLQYQIDRYHDYFPDK